MTMLVHDAVMLEVPVDTARLFDGDPLYTIWMSQLVDRVADSRQRQHRQRREDTEDDA